MFRAQDSSDQSDDDQKNRSCYYEIASKTTIHRFSPKSIPIHQLASFLPADNGIPNFFHIKEEFSILRNVYSLRPARKAGGLSVFLALAAPLQMKGSALVLVVLLYAGSSPQNE